MKLILQINIIILFAVTIPSFNAVGQKLPNKQEGGLHAPANVRIDGKAAEWTFKAYNNAADVFYTVANDDKNIYLAIKAEDISIVRKILSAGITVTLDKSGKNAETGAVSITYPLFDYKNKPDIILSVKSMKPATADSVVLANSKKFNSQSKFISVNGFKGLDTLISVYNTDGINVGAAFDKQMSYIYELSVSRSLITNLISADGKFVYKVSLGALKLEDIPGVKIQRDAGGTITGVSVNKSEVPPLSMGAQVTTDFSGEYTLTR